MYRSCASRLEMYFVCKNGDVGDEYHYLCVCSYFNAERTKFIGNGTIMNPLTYRQFY